MNYSDDENEYTGFLGLGKKAKARRQERFATKMETKKARASNIRSKADSRVLLATLGKPMQSGFAQSLGGVAGVVGSLLGGGQQQIDNVLEPRPISQVPLNPPILTTVPTSIGDAIQMAKEIIQPQAPMPQDGYMPQTPGYFPQPDAATGSGSMPPVKTDKNKMYMIGGAALLIVLLLVVVLKK